MYKVISADQSSVIRKIREAGLNKRIQPLNMHRKSAEMHTGSPALLYADSYKKRKPGNEVLVTVACCSYEIYGPNSNGDGFPSEKAIPALNIEEADLLTKHYLSFEKGKVHWMHDMDQPVGWVLKAYWNDRYKWVELVIELDEDRIDPEVMKRIRADEMIFVSMGCDVRYDVCSICGTKSRMEKKNGKDVKITCDHIKDGLLNIYDGVIAAMLNPSPDFDDISVVFIPADAIASSLYRKAASAEGAKFIPGMKPVDIKKVAEVTKNLNKIADLYKNTAVLRSVNKFKNNYPELVSGMKEGVEAEDLSSVFAYFVKKAVPMPIASVAKKWNIDLDKIIDIQGSVISRALKDSELAEAFKTATDIENKKGFSEAMALISDKVEDLGKDSREALAAAVFNIINKLRISESTVDPSILPSGSPEVRSVEDVIELEFLMEE